MFDLKSRLRAGAIHLALSALTLGPVAWLVFRDWYPPPYAAIAGGTSLFTILVGLQLGLGPLLTTVVAAAGKGRRLLVRDVSVICVVQFAALVWGVHVMAAARPVALVFSVDRFQLVSAAELDPSALLEAPEKLRALSWSGPQLIAAKKPTSADELMRSIDLALAGADLPLQPRHWVSYDELRAEAWRRARPVQALTARYQVAAELGRIAQAARLPVEALRFLPLLGRRANCVVLIAAPDARIVGTLPVEGYF